MKPIFSYYGGKVRLAPKIVPYLLKIRHETYCEPFAGGAAVLFGKPIPESKNYKEAINDKNILVTNFYQVCQNRKEDLLRLLSATLHSQSDYQRACRICKAPEKYREIDLAWAFYVNICQSFSKKLNGGWATSVKTPLAPLWRNRIERLNTSSERIKNTVIENTEALSFIKKWDSPTTLFYIDPPYPNANQGHYAGYTEKDWQNLCVLLDKIQGSYVLSNYEQKVQPKSTQQKIKLKVHCSSSGEGFVGISNKKKHLSIKKSSLGNRTRTEILWICDRTKA